MTIWTVYVGTQKKYIYLQLLSIGLDLPGKNAFIILLCIYMISR